MLRLRTIRAASSRASLEGGIEAAYAEEGAPDRVRGEAQAADNHCNAGYGNETVSQIAVPFCWAGLGLDSGPVSDGCRDRFLDLCEVSAAW